MTKKVFTFIFPSSLLIILLAIGVMTWLFSDLFKDFYLKTTKERLQTNALAMEPAVAEELTAPKDIPGLRKLVSRFSEDTSSRITVIAPNGTVIADSYTKPSEMENHTTPDRKEILAALKGENLPKNLSTVGIVIDEWNVQPNSSSWFSWQRLMSQVRTQS